MTKTEILDTQRTWVNWKLNQLENEVSYLLRRGIDKRMLQFNSTMEAIEAYISRKNRLQNMWLRLRAAQTMGLTGE